jgi:hypothetical protein
MAKILFEVSASPFQATSDNLCYEYEVRFTEPVNAFWLIAVIKEALEKETKEIEDS